MKWNCYKMFTAMTLIPQLVFHLVILIFTCTCISNMHVTLSSFLLSNSCHYLYFRNFQTFLIIRKIIKNNPILSITTLAALFMTDLVSLKFSSIFISLGCFFFYVKNFSWSKMYIWKCTDPQGMLLKFSKEHPT